MDGVPSVAELWEIGTKSVHLVNLLGYVKHAQNAGIKIGCPLKKRKAWVLFLEIRCFLRLCSFFVKIRLAGSKGEAWTKI